MTTICAASTERVPCARPRNACQYHRRATASRHRGSGTGLHQLGLHPVHMVQGPRLIQQTPHCAPGLAPQCPQGVGALRLRPRPVLALPVGPHTGQGRPEAFHRRVHLHGLVKGALRFAPRGPRASGSSPRLEALLCGVRDLLIRLCCGVYELFCPRPLAADHPLHLTLGVQHLQADLDRRARDLGRRKGGAHARRVQECDTARQTGPRVTDHPYHARPLLEHPTPAVPRAVRPTLPRHPRHAVGFDCYQHRVPMNEDLVQAQGYHASLTDAIQHRQDATRLTTGLLDPAPDGCPARYATRGQHDGQ